MFGTDTWGVTRGYKDGLQPEFLADGWWNKINQCRKMKLNLTETWGVCMSLDSEMHCHRLGVTYDIFFYKWKQWKNRKTTQAAKHSLHQLRKRRHIGPKCRESPPPKEQESLCAYCTEWACNLRAVLWELCESRPSSLDDAKCWRYRLILPHQEGWCEV